MMDEGGVEVDGKLDEAMLKVICETDAGGMNHVIRVVPSDVLSPFYSSSCLFCLIICPQILFPPAFHVSISLCISVPLILFPIPEP